MRTLVVVAHPDPDSLTHHVAGRLAASLAPLPVEVADLAAEGFDPRYTLADRRAYRGDAPLPEDVGREVDRLAGVDHLVLVFPLYWWSVPALLKGWLDRVLVGGFAFTVTPGGDVIPALQRLTVHVVPVAATAAGPLARHGYESALRTQLEHGVVDYCGARRGVFALVDGSEDAGAPARAADAVARVVRGVRAGAEAGA